MRTAALFLVVILGAASVRADDVQPAVSSPPPGATSGALEDAVPEATPLSGKDIYARVLDNRLRASYQQEVLVSMDAAGNQASSGLWIRFKDYRDEAGEDDAQAKFMVKYTEPRDMRGSGYLVIQNETRPDDQFVYFPSNRKVKRVNLSDTILGTDFALEDIVPRGLADSEYARLDDQELDGRPCHVIEIMPKQDADSQYSKLRTWVDREKWIPLKTLYWDLAGVQVKEYVVDPATIEQVGNASIARSSTMRSLADRSKTEREIRSLDSKPDMRDSMFSISKLKSRR